MKRAYVGFILVSMVFLSGAQSCPKGEERLEHRAPLAKKAEAKVEGGQVTPEVPSQRADKGSFCEKDDDCTTIKTDCCGCRQGGAQKAIAKAALDSAEAEQKTRCQGTMCIQAISTDASCSKKSVCESGHCVLK